MSKQAASRTGAWGRGPVHGYLFAAVEDTGAFVAGVRALQPAAG